ncbi:kinase anchor [Fusarium sporotrichioides]|uniref:RING-type E3 ubiquitin transferase n=1 Tax=Fusarium sporotrichioides TaxID=5514 RepID=A0A395RUW0_FUSSP|nr:kinase anchor [Fusarium sporotrichioides]
MASPSGASGHLGPESAGDHSAPLSNNSQSPPRSINSDDSQNENDQHDQDHDQNNDREPICPWRTSRFQNQECSRYFDCPSHAIERSLSESGEADRESIHSSHSPEIPPSDNGREQTDQQNSRFSDQELAQGVNNGHDAQSTPTDEPDDDGDATSATTDPATSAEEDAGTAVAQESSDTQQNTEMDDSESRSQNRRSDQHDSPNTPSDHPEHMQRSSRGTSAINTQRAQRTYATPSRERMDAPLPSLRPLEEALPPLPRSARQSVSSDSQRPRWQPDNEVTYCPICHTQFSFFVRKHHCRKCGRVVCNSCSPHRIIIPHQYIVRPPGAEAAMHHSLLVDGLGAGYFDVNDMSGGERGSTSSGSSPGTSHRRRSGAHQTPIERFLASAQAASPSSYPERYSSLGESSSRQRALPPTPQIAEEDECPICHRELPSSSLPNAEALRESHITTCIQTHSTYGTPRGGEGGAPVAPRRTGMYTYVATEKDCIDDAECTICLEEFTVGVPMARLECLCRFHRACISSWFVKHPGRCPVHQHDGFGY